MLLKTLVVQNSAIIGNKNATFRNVDMLLQKYSELKPDIIVFPEVWSNGWVCSDFVNSSEYIDDSETIAFLRNVALDFRALVVGGSFIQKVDVGFKNTCPIISSNGKLVTTYDKMHLFSHKGSEENKYIQAGSKLKIVNYRGVKIGLSICYDIRFPELYRRYSSLGVDILINMAAWSSTKPEHWNVMHRARAIENQSFMIVANQTGKIKNNDYNLGYSMVINPWGDVISTLESEEGCLYTEINTDEVSKLRQDFPLLYDRRDSAFTSFDFEEITIYE